MVIETRIRNVALAMMLLVFIKLPLVSQTLIPTAENAFESQLPFNTEYIKSQKSNRLPLILLTKKTYK